MIKDEITEWLDEILEEISEMEIPNEIAAFGFNLYDDGGHNWSMELIGTSEFDINNPDWLCREVTDFDTREDPFQWHQEGEWQEIQRVMSETIKEYLSTGEYANILKNKFGIGIGFVDGDVEILYKK